MGVSSGCEKQSIVSVRPESREAFGAETRRDLSVRRRKKKNAPRGTAAGRLTSAARLQSFQIFNIYNWRSKAPRDLLCSAPMAAWIMWRTVDAASHTAVFPRKFFCGYVGTCWLTDHRLRSQCSWWVGSRVVLVAQVGDHGPMHCHGSHSRLRACLGTSAHVRTQHMCRSACLFWKNFRWQWHRRSVGGQDLVVLVSTVT